MSRSWINAWTGSGLWFILSSCPPTGLAISEGYYSTAITIFSSVEPADLLLNEGALCNICLLVLSYLRFPGRGLIGIFWRASRGEILDVLATDGTRASSTKPGWVLVKLHMKIKSNTPKNWRDSPRWWPQYDGLSLSVRWQELDQSALIFGEENTQFCNLELGSFSGLKKTDRGAAIACGWRGHLQLEKETGNREQNCNSFTEMVSSSISGCLHNKAFKWSLWNRNKPPLQVADLRGCWIS